MKYSIIIPAYNEEKNIGRAIQSLLTQTISRSEYEIIAVDNNSKDDTSKAAQEAGADRVFLEKEKGTNMARNRGYKESHGDIIAFIDADCEVPKDWLSRVQKDFENKKIQAISGPYDYQFGALESIASFIYNSILLRIAPKMLHIIFGKRAGVIIGGNFAVRRSALDAIGGIPPLAFWGDDAALAMLISRNVGEVFFDPHLVVVSSPRRFEKEGLLHLSFLYVKAYLKVYFNTPGE